MKCVSPDRINSIMMVRTSATLFSLYHVIMASMTNGFSPAFVSNIRMNGGSSTSLQMSEVEEVKVGDKIPSVTLMKGQPDFGAPEPVDLAELIAGKKVIIFAVPGAFTPGCSKSHVPSFITAKDELQEKGVDLVVCVATNDAYVMEAWGKSYGGEEETGIIFLSDGDAELTKAFGLTMGSETFTRSKRYSLIAEDGVVTEYFSSAEEASNTWAPSVLSKL